MERKGKERKAYPKKEYERKECEKLLSSYVNTLYNRKEPSSSGMEGGYLCRRIEKPSISAH